ncbi:MAG: glutathione S-transferase family protein [Rhodospirillaceae bacterium]|nr:glutathione S-transferase family protein [Rhodospirillaceae bacterium]MBT3883298.1 glutathione S-transferase family protein [Rhodospirillaceae bacterium]MBT4115753.1 glutathione S-transferase family protein [Rhodospirillaceae bacterium]MBT4674425.1 glutathione S-transferase family protein [Rhodospirillaceae bacterium]MBT4719605.1 glutathione S-transferase family protein [Rhodospirillaceae bacterium]
MILLRAKDIDFEVTYVNLQEKPDWFLEISPHGKVPVLKVDDEVLFESNAIAEFLDEMVEPRLHPENPIKRARNRAWTDYTPTWSSAFGKVNYAKTKEDLDAALEALPVVLAKLEGALEAERGNDGPFFNGEKLCLVDAAFAPSLQRFAMIENIVHSGTLDSFPKVKAWSDALLAEDAIINSVAEDFGDAFNAALKRRETYCGTLIETAAAAE